MKTRVVIFTREAHPGSETPSRILFARWSPTLFHELPAQMGVEDFAQALTLKRHSKFDYAVGDRGRLATLLEWVDGSNIPKQLPLGRDGSLDLVWEPFRDTVQALQDGTDRRILQLAVQFIASGADLDESVIAADYDAEFLQQLQTALKSKSE